MDAGEAAGCNRGSGPGGIGVFAVCIIGLRDGWLAAVTDRVYRRCRTAALLAVAGPAVGMLGLGALGGVEDVAGGWNRLSLGFAAFESILVVFGSVWLLGWCSGASTGRCGGSARVASRSAYGSFIVQELALIGFAVALRPVPVLAEVRVLAFVDGGIAGSFALAWLLIARVPGVARVF